MEIEELKAKYGTTPNAEMKELEDGGGEAVTIDQKSKIDAVFPEQRHGSFAVYFRKRDAYTDCSE